MNLRRLGRTNLQVSEIGFGCWAIGGSGYGPTSDETSLEALETAWQQGINFYDTADTYGHGHSEDLLSQFLKNKPRDKVILASKAGWDFYPPGGEARPGGRRGGSKKNFDPAYLAFACEQSLKRLKTDYIDIYQLHNPLPDLIEKGDAVGALLKLKEQGKIRFIGISIHTERDALAAVADSRVDTLQLIFNFLDQRMLDKIFPLCQKEDRGMIVREPLACGLLTGKYESAGHIFPKEDHRRRWTREKLQLEIDKVAAFKKQLAKPDLSMAQAALEYALQFKQIGVVIPGAKTKMQVLGNVKASLEPQLDSREQLQLRELYQKEEIFKKFIA